MDELDHYTGNVWTHIISLHREDAEQLGYDHAEAWRTLLRTYRNDIAAAMKIPPEDFHWYAAFHDEGNHPHVHMMAWSAKAESGVLVQRWDTADQVHADQPDLPSGATGAGRLADAGDAYAQYIIGMAYRDGGLLIPDTVKAQKLLERTAEQDLDAAQYALGKLYLSDDADVHDSAKRYLLAETLGGQRQRFRRLPAGQGISQR